MAENLATLEPQSPDNDKHELSTAREQADAVARVQAAMAIAQRYPRNEMESFSMVVRSCARPTFAEDAEYSFTRGGTVVKGPSVYLAREFARCWGNIETGIQVVRSDGATMTVRGWARDLQRNTYHEEEDHFRLMVKRKEGYRAADEREIREEKNRRGSMCQRNALLRLLPSDLVEEALSVSRKTRQDKTAKDPDSARNALVTAFAQLPGAVKANDLELYLGHEIAQCSSEELDDLRTIWRSLKDGYSKWSDYYTPPVVATEETAGEPPATGLKGAMKRKREPGEE